VILEIKGNSGSGKTTLTRQFMQLGRRSSGYETKKYVGWTSGRTWAQGGAGYWLDRECMAAVGSSRLLPPVHNMEDCMVGSTLA
jgi:ABC-type dipeptide/oligopeptide/nickel transport system ATPase component